MIIKMLYSWDDMDIFTSAYSKYILLAAETLTHDAATERSNISTFIIH